MLKLSDGNCGLCEHFGGEHSDEPRLVQLRVNGQGPEDMIEPCGHPEHRSLNLQVTPISGCAGFTPAKSA